MQTNSPSNNFNIPEELQELFILLDKERPDFQSLQNKIYHVD